MTIAAGPVPARRRYNNANRRLEAEINQQLKALDDNTGVEFRVEPRCRVCQQEESRQLVNRMLANAFSYTEILETINLAINPHRAKNAQVTYRSVYYHAKLHFNLEEPAKAAYRKILERRRAEVGDQVTGVDRLITAFGFLDVVAHKGYETLVKEDTVIPVGLGMDAVVKLHQLLRQETSQQEAAELRAQLAVIQSVVKEVVPQEYWNDIIARIEEAEDRMAANVVDVEVVDDEDDDDDAYSPPIETDADDTLEL